MSFLKFNREDINIENSPTFDLNKEGIYLICLAGNDEYCQAGKICKYCGTLLTCQTENDRCSKEPDNNMHNS